MFSCNVKSWSWLLMVLCGLSCQLANAVEEGLTSFIPSEDFLPVATSRSETFPGWQGACLGITEASVVYSNHRQPSEPRLADVGTTLVKTRGESFVRDIQHLAQNNAYTTVKAPVSGDRLADLLYADLKRTHKPQVLGLDLPNKKRHALVVYDAQKMANNKIGFKVGDPKTPTKDNLWIVYDRDAMDWVDLTGQMPGGFEPNFIRWDDKNKRTDEIPHQQKYLDLIDLAQDPTLSAENIANMLSIRVPYGKMFPVTKKHQLDNDPGMEVAGTSWKTVEGRVYVFRFENGGSLSHTAGGQGNWWHVKDNVFQGKRVMNAGGQTLTYNYTFTFHNNDATVEWTGIRGSQRGQGTFQLTKIK